ncbi:MAG TPA: PAAR domain-containing protein [Azospirillaceae bacterium]|nr:PAAR domain-containing protein [Azospirillaceae bacterium]
MPPAARLSDLHICPEETPGLPPIPHVGGPVIGPGAATVRIGRLPAARVGDSLFCVGPPDSIVQGSKTVMIEGRPAARLGDTTAHGGKIVAGLATVMIGG